MRPVRSLGSLTSRSRNGLGSDTQGRPGDWARSPYGGDETFQVNGTSFQAILPPPIWKKQEQRVRSETLFPLRWHIAFWTIVLACIALYLHIGHL
ncbi:hypothetical protein GQ53DRAFT_749282 [Thozetella sp. PMI_491]|nr:hypothetical protein GQ53DRAFT_749282 [Thozetella sp. PMI_491]